MTQALGKAHFADPEIGTFILGKGIYFGNWEPVQHCWIVNPSLSDEDFTVTTRRKLGKRYQLFAAPEDLKEIDGTRVIASFERAAEEVAGLKDWHGYDGSPFNNYDALYQALETDRYQGGWFIPPLQLLMNVSRYRAFAGDNDTGHNLFDYRNADAFKGTFATHRGGHLLQEEYWSSTRIGGQMYGNFDNGTVSDLPGGLRSCRPCRVEFIL
ncbi:MAG: hypothetical protein WAO98_03720 [Alphaproteobacteria bacterium]